MKALVKSHAKEGIWLEDVSEPDVGNNDVLIKECYLKSLERTPGKFLIHNYFIPIFLIFLPFC